ncbi:Imm63 family immunity protein [Sphingomonas sp.]|uniref:Imm63 family immunity protein n=1 Tax=Sphingomonas sp. TaxID=28214 RepID=UPI00286BCAEC|nr:Imm63 family immunity protein [Sphingomonas sp.]
MHNGNDDLLDAKTIQKKVKSLAHQLGREDFTIASRPRGDGSPYIEVGDAYYFIVEERGVELERRKTGDLDELLYWAMRALTFSLSWEYELRNRSEGADSRRQAFAKELELPELLSPAWAKRRGAEYEEILRTNPFHDS